MEERLEEFVMRAKESDHMNLGNSYWDKEKEIKKKG